MLKEIVQKFLELDHHFYQNFDEVFYQFGHEILSDAVLVVSLQWITV